MPGIRDLNGRPIEYDDDADIGGARVAKAVAPPPVVNVPIPDDVAMLIDRMNAQVDIAVAAVAEVQALAIAIRTRVQHDVNRFGRLAAVEDALKNAGLSL